MISFENFLPKFKNLFFFRYIISERELQNNSGRFLCIINAKPAQFLVLCVSQGVFHLRLVTNITQHFFKNGFKKKSTLSFMEKYLPYNFHIWKNACRRDFIHFSVCMELYEIVQ